MPTKPIPISEMIVKAVDEVGLVTHGAELRDGYVDELGNINRRPGLDAFADTGEVSSVDGIFWWEAEDLALVVCNGKTFKITDNLGTISEITHDDTAWEIGTRVRFADYKTSIYGANGALIKEVPNSGNIIDMADAQAPTSVSHIAFLDRYLLANEIGTRNFHSSDVGAPNAWTGNSWDVEGKLDDLLALGVADREIAALGEKTFEAWRNDGVTPFVRELQGFVESGTIAAQSLTWCGVHGWIWLDQDRNVVQLKARTPIVLSVTMTKYIQGFGTVSDAVGDYAVIAGRPWFIAHFPTEEKTLAFDLMLQRWYLWNYWDAAQAEYDRWRGNVVCLAPGWNFTLVGDRSNGIVYKMNDTTYDDNGDILRTMVRTAHINWGTEAKKKDSHSLTFRVKRTNVAQQADAAEMMVKWRDDGSTTWKTEHTIALGQVGDTEFRGQHRRCGQYFSRQYEFTLSDASPLVLVSVEEDFDILT
jgi:hypothetical protein